MARKKREFTCRYCGKSYVAWHEYKRKRCSEQCAKVDWEHGFLKWLLRTIERHGNFEEALTEFDAFEVYAVYDQANKMRGYYRIQGEVDVHRRIDIAHLYPVSAEWISALAGWNLVAVPEKVNRSLGKTVYQGHVHTGVRKEHGTLIQNVREFLMQETNLPELVRKKNLVRRESDGKDFIARFKDDWLGVPEEMHRITGLPERLFKLEPEEWEEAEPMARSLLEGTVHERMDELVTENLVSGNNGRVLAFLGKYEELTRRGDNGHAAEQAYCYVQDCLFKAGGVAERVGTDLHHTY